VVGDGRPGLALVALSVFEQRYRGVTAVMDGSSVTEVAAGSAFGAETVQCGWRRIAAIRWPLWDSLGLRGLEGRWRSSRCTAT
jgi:hypothetical protein